MEIEVSRVGEIPIPLINYVYLIKNRKSPYYDLVQFLLKEMEMRYLKSGQSEVIYTINRRVLQEEIEKKIKSDKLTNINICRTTLAFLYASGAKEEKDFYVTTTGGGKRNYHIVLNKNTLNSFTRLLI